MSIAAGSFWIPDRVRNDGGDPNQLLKSEQLPVRSYIGNAYPIMAWKRATCNLSTAGTQACFPAASVGKTMASQLSCLPALTAYVQPMGDSLAYCSNCGQQGAPDAAYCYNCGGFMGVPEAPPPPDRPGAADGPGGVPWSTRHVGLGIVVVGVLSVPAAYVAVYIGRQVEQYEEALSAWLGVHLVGLVVIGAVWYLGIRAFDARWSALGLRPPAVPWPRAALWAVGTLAASLAASFIYVAIVDLTGAEFLSPPDIPSDIVFPGAAAVFTFQALAVVTPVVEEVFFRGFVFAGLVPRLGVGRAAVVSAVVFSAFHLELAVLIPIFVTGLLLAWLYQRTGSLWPGVLAHAGQNTLALAVAVGIYGV